ncbi:hypothetical protein GUJ93_ZPchr0003g17551 [Zizania palustris]|uniref:Dirigent protein n=1 Tax=Zizania palustris TaxID=103762 RepID=A0A8J5VXI8_ZIZPA|nr:hypothetical protein GUJ93_ZPchr0003g17551 [Zizania palustris]
MLGRIIFCVVIAAAVLAVVLLATVSPLPGRSDGHRGGPDHLRTLTVYIHQTAPPAAPSGSVPPQRRREGEEASALVFRHRMTAGPESASRTVGAASGFVLLPGAEGAAATSVFDTVHLAFDAAAGMSGSLCVQAGGEKPPAPAPRRRQQRRRGDGGEVTEVLRVVGGTGAFAFVSRGEAVLRSATAGKVLRLELRLAPAKG